MRRKNITWLPLFLAVASLACLAIYDAAKGFETVGRVVGRHPDPILCVDLLCALGGVILGICILQRNQNDPLVKFGTLLSVLALLLYLLLPSL